MASLGLAAVTHSETRLALAALLWLILELKSRIEEEALVALYPQQYEEYKTRVKKFVPFIY